MSNKYGTPIPSLAPKEIVDHGFNWEISPETIKAIEEIEENSRRAEAYLRYCWHYYV